MIYMDYKNYCKNIFECEIEKEKINNATLKILPLGTLFSSGFIKPNIEKSNYKVVINSSSYANMKESNKLFYMCVTIFHEIEHIKTFEKTKNETFFDYEHLISLMEYITYLEEFDIPYNKIDIGIKTKQLITRSLKKNYKVSSSEIKCSLVGYEKAINCCFIKNKDTIYTIIESLRFLNNNMQLFYNKSDVPIDKFALFIIKTSKYINKYPELLKEYKILNNFFYTDGRMKNIYDIYLNINEKNKTFYDKYLINLLSVSLINDNFLSSLDDDNYKEYISRLICNYTDSIVNYYENIELGNIFVGNKKILYDNLKILLLRIKNLNNLSMKCGIKYNTRKII